MHLATGFHQGKPWWTAGWCPGFTLGANLSDHGGAGFSPGAKPGGPPESLAQFSRFPPWVSPMFYPGGSRIRPPQGKVVLLWFLRSVSDRNPGFNQVQDRITVLRLVEIPGSDRLSWFKTPAGKIVFSGAGADRSGERNRFSRFSPWLKPGGEPAGDRIYISGRFPPWF